MISIDEGDEDDDFTITTRNSNVSISETYLRERSEFEDKKEDPLQANILFPSQVSQIGLYYYSQPHLYIFNYTFICI